VQASVVTEAQVEDLKQKSQKKTHPGEYKAIMPRK
jgi:hypothetical protein